MNEKIRSEVNDVLGADTSGHSIDHVDRVVRMSMEFAEHEAADPEITSLIALLHDADDYKLFGRESAENLTNATKILDRNAIDAKIARQVLKAIPMMGYNNYLEGIRPDTIEGKIVSDADMNDAIGARGLIRVFEYNASKGRPFFDKSISPVTDELSAEEYRASPNEHAVQHFFDKLLLIPDIMMTKSGYKEAKERAIVMEEFLKEMFREEDAQEWLEYLDAFIKNKSRVLAP